MSDKQEIGVGIGEVDQKQVQIFLGKFLKHVNLKKLAICGGLTTRFHLTQHGVDFPQRPFNDLDLLIESPNDVLSTITAELMLYHFHPANPNDSIEPNYFFYAFVDPESRIKADVFPYRWSASERFVKAIFQGQSINVCGIEDQLIQCLYDVSRISNAQKVDPKQLRDVHTLAQIADMPLAEKIWKHNNHPLYPKTLQEAIDRADNIVIDYPDWWQEKPYRKPKPYYCSFCQSRLSYPITDMREIYKVLGYVE